MVVGSGRTIHEVAEEVLRRKDEMELWGFTLGRGASLMVNGTEIVQIEPILFHEQGLAEAFSGVVVDFTSRRETLRFLDNVRLYRRHKMPVVVGEDRAYIVGKTSVSVAVVPNVRPESCHLIVPLVIEAIEKLSSVRGRGRAFYHVHDLVRTIAI